MKPNGNWNSARKKRDIKLENVSKMCLISCLTGEIDKNVAGK